MEGFGSFFGCDSDSVTEELSLLAKSQISHLPPEAHLGNIEYKLKMVNPSVERIEHLTTQMKWRLEEGNGVALYEVGVEDNGNVVGLLPADFQSSIKNLKSIVEKLNAYMDIIKVRRIISSNNEILLAAEILVHLNQHTVCGTSDLRIAFIGSTDSGKSSLIGTLSSGMLDNGDGRARLTLFRHLHEVVTGRTSSIAEQTIGLEKSTGCVITLAQCRNPMEMVFRCDKLITFIDLAGHRKYIRTTLYGLTSRRPQYVIVVIDKLRGLVSSVIDQINIALSMHMPPIIVLTKIDLCPRNFKTNDLQLCSIVKELASSNFVKHFPPCQVINTSDNLQFLADQFSQRKLTPIFQVSCVYGYGLDEIYTFISALSNKHADIRNISFPNQCEFQIDHVFSFEHSTLIVRGLQIKGYIHTKDKVLMGPLINGNFIKVEVKSVRRMNVPVNVVYCGQSASLALAVHEIKSVKKKGLVLISNLSDQANVCRSFQGKITFLPSKSVKITLRNGCRFTLHMDNICQTVIVNEYQENSNELTLTFQAGYAYVDIGRKFILWEIRATGIVTKIL